MDYVAIIDFNFYWYLLLKFLNFVIIIFYTLF